MLVALVLLGLAIGGVLLDARREPFPARDYAGLPSTTAAGTLVGTNYTHTGFAKCSWEGNAVLPEYHRDEVRERVHAQLRAMRRRGVASLRTILWHMTDPGPNDWGPVPSRGGRLPEPYRTSLREYLQEVRRFGFRRLTVSLGPQYENSPVDEGYDPAKLEENRRFVEDVRPLIKRHGPADTRIDLINEGAPSDYLDPALRRQMSDYATRIYAAYGRRFGTGDATISVIGPENLGDRGNRLQNLVDALRASGQPLPRWTEVHLTYAPDVVLHGLREVARVLRRNRLPVRIVIGETSYDDPGVAAAIERFGGARAGVEEILPWYHRPGQRCNASPPYSVAAYASAAR